MPRKKLQFTEECDQLIKIAVSQNLSLETIVEKLFNELNFKTSIPTISNHIKELGLDKVDNRKSNLNSNEGVGDQIGMTKPTSPTKSVMSRYKIKKYDESDRVIDKEYLYGLGLDTNGKPEYYELDYGADGVCEEVILKITFDDVRYGGGKDCVKYSNRWWIIERMRFDFGCKYRGLLSGQKKGDWRGVVNRFLYTDDDFLRIDTSYDIVADQQDAWKRFVDAVLSQMDEPDEYASRHINNKFIINTFNEAQFEELYDKAPNLLYKYIPTYLYPKVVIYCLDKMKEDGRLIDRDENKLNMLKNIISRCKTTNNLYECEAITLDRVKRCLQRQVNDYHNVILSCCTNAVSLGLIDSKYCDALVDVVSKIKIKPVEKVVFDSMDWLAVTGPHTDDFHNAFYKSENGYKEFCKKYDLR